MSVDRKLLSSHSSRFRANDAEETTTEKQLHDHAYGITSDPLTFACIFAALIHDVDHPGVPNSQLIKRRQVLPSIYKDKSIAEQNSVSGGICLW
jgi:hypothetical protein